jgi:hypothetical protein
MHLDKQCVCPSPNTTDSVHRTHHKEGHRKSMRDGVPNRILQKIHALTKVDVQLYKMVLVEFLQELLWLEHQLGRQVVCDSKFQSLDFELEYLWLGKISKLYSTIKEFQQQ